MEYTTYPNKTKLKFNFYFEDNNSINCLSHEFVTYSSDSDEIFDELNSFYQKFEKFVERTLYSTIVTKEMYFESISDFNILEDLYEKIHEFMHNNFVGLVDIDCSESILNNLNSSQKSQFEIERKSNDSLFSKIDLLGLGIN
jgi:hypothetical protein